MQIRTWLPALLALATFGCGTEGKLTATGPSASQLRSSSASATGAGGASSPGAVYAMTNAPSGNAVLMFPRSTTGALGAPRSFSTGGTGTGAGLGNQGALATDQGGRWLYVVNAGSNDVSVFRVSPSGLELADREASGGEQPIGVTTYKDLVYVLNAGGSGGIQGFRVSPTGDLTAIAGSNRPLSSASAGPAQIGFLPDGSGLVVSEKATNTLSLYRVAADGSATGPVSHASSGATPFGFAFDRNRTLVVSEAFGGGAGASAASSYLAGNGTISLVSGSVPTGQTAACWVAVSDNGRFAYTTNAGSGSLTGYAIGADGSLSRIAGPAGTTATAAGPLDMCFSNGSRFLYVLNGTAHMISGYAVDAQGGLTAVDQVPAPAGINGLAGH